MDDSHTNVVDNHSHPSLDWHSRAIHEAMVVKGFWGGSCSGMEYPSDDKLMAKLALVHSEITEILEAFRKGYGEDLIVEEFADTIIRLLDLYGAMWDHDIVTVSLQDAFDLKMKKNEVRPQMHGHKWG